MDLVESTWRVCEGVTLTRWMLSPERESWTVRWTTTGDDRRQRAGVSAAEVLRVAADEAPGRYRDALLAAAADPPRVPFGRDTRNDSASTVEHALRANGNPRLGSRFVTMINEQEAKSIARARELRAEGLSLRAIADRLNAEKMPARGARWYHTTVQRVLADHDHRPEVTAKD